MARRILVTSALPYANGPIHLGHMTEVIQCDIWVRAMRLMGHECVYVCADDTHGTPIMLKAEAEGVTPEQLIERVGAERRADFAAFGIDFDNYYTTHSEENRRLTVRMYEALVKAATSPGAACARPTTRRPACSCRIATSRAAVPAAGRRTSTATVARTAAPLMRLPTSLTRSRVVSGTRPVERESEHIFFRLGNFGNMLRAWTRSGTLQTAVANKLDEWFEAGAARLGHLARRALLRLRDPGRAGQVFLRLARRAGRLHGELRQLVQAARPRLRRLVAAGERRRAAPLHRQGHRVLPLAVLAGDAGGRGLPEAHRACTCTAS